MIRIRVTILGLEGLGGDDMYTSNVYIGLVLAPSGSSFLYVPKPKMQQLLLAAMLCYALYRYRNNGKGCDFETLFFHNIRVKTVVVLS